MKKLNKTYWFVFLIIAIVGACIAILEFPFLVPPFQYLLFAHRSPGYYARIAEDCDTLLRANPVTSNNVVQITKTISKPFAIKIPGNDPGLPYSIRNLRPDFVLIGSNSVAVFVPPERAGGFGILWIQDEMLLNRWLLEVDADGEPRTVFQIQK